MGEGAPPEDLGPRADGDVVEVYGVTLRAPFPLPSARASRVPTPDLEVRVHPPQALPTGDPPGPLVLDAVADGRRHYALARVGDIFHLCIPELGHFVLDVRRGTLDCTLLPGVDPALLEVLLTGMIPALWLYLQGELVLHAAAITVEGQTIAWCGGSGRGKSTMAALLCAAGATLVADDVLCLRDDVDGFHWHGSAPELRLRYPAAHYFGEALGTFPSRTTADGRLAIAVATTPGERGPLAMVVVPRPGPGTTDLAVERLRPAKALLDLAGSPRLGGWRDPVVLAGQFEGLAKLVDAVPVLEAAIPWRVPFDESVARQLLPALFAAAGRG